LVRPCLENEKVLLGKEPVANGDPVSRFSHFSFDDLWHQLVSWATIRLGSIVDDRHPCLDPKLVLEASEVINSAVDVVIGIADEDQIHGLRKMGIRGLGQDADQIGESFPTGTIIEIEDHVGLDVHPVHDTPGKSGGEAHGEVARAGADVRHHEIVSGCQQRYYGVGVLPGFTFGVLETLGPLLRVLEAAMGRGVVSVPVGLVGIGRSDQRGEYQPSGQKECKGEAARGPATRATDMFRVHQDYLLVGTVDAAMIAVPCQVRIMFC
jgi:hypothetical protein